MTLNRRRFCSELGTGMLAAGLGTTLVTELGLATTIAEDDQSSIPLGRYAELVDLMRNTAPEKLQPLLAGKIIQGATDLRSLVAAGALANAVTFGGCDYVGFHTAMAMLPSLAMSQQLPRDRQPLPVLKVLYRNSQQIQSVGGASTKAFDVERAPLASSIAEDTAVGIRDACREPDIIGGEQLLASVAESPRQALNSLQLAVQDDMNVHRFVFAHRTYGLVGLLGPQYSYSLLRQCVRFCANHEQMRIERQYPVSPIRDLMPRLLDQYKLDGIQTGRRDPGDAAVEELSQVIYYGPRDRAAEATAAALAEGIAPEVVGEAISLASNQYVLRQPTEKGRTHGDSAGVHSSDATNAWRNMARVTDPKYAISGLIVAAYHAGVQSAPFEAPAFPTVEHRALVKVSDAGGLLAETEDAIRQNDQGRASAAIQIYGEKAFPVEPVFDLMLKYAVSEDGRLHGEKFFHTVREEYRTTRPAFRWRHVVALARVTASAYGYNREDQHGFRAAGYEEACRLLGVDT